MATPEDRIIIDSTELEEARRDPAVHDLIDEAVAEGEQVVAEGRDMTGITAAESPFAYAAHAALEAARREAAGGDII